MPKADSIKKLPLLSEEARLKPTFNENINILNFRSNIYGFISFFNISKSKYLAIYLK